MPSLLIILLALGLVALIMAVVFGVMLWNMHNGSESRRLEMRLEALGAAKRQETHFIVERKYSEIEVLHRFFERVPFFQELDTRLVGAGHGNLTLDRFLLIVLALALLGSWQTLIALIGSRTILAGIIFAVLMIVLGYFVALGGKKTRSSVALLEPISNAGPVFAAVAIAFNNDPEILGAATGIILVQIIVGTIIASYFAKGQPAPEEIPAEGPAAVA